MIHTEINKLQEEFQKDVAFYKDINDQLHREINLLKKQVQEVSKIHLNILCETNFLSLLLFCIKCVLF